MKTIFNDCNIKYFIDDDKKKVYITNMTGKNLYFSNKFVDISYASKESVSSALSNLFPYEFVFRGHKVKSVEGVLQSLKHKDIEMQHLVQNYAGKDAYHTRATSFAHDWRKKGELYFEGQTIDRFGIEYQVLLNELYLSVYTNPIFASILNYTGNRVLLHSNGISDPRETVLTPSEYVNRLKVIRDCILQYRDALPSLNALNELIIDGYEQKEYRKK